MTPNKHFKSIAASIGRAQAAQGNLPLPHIVNKHQIVFADDQHVKGYDAIVTQKMLATLH